VEVGDEGEQEGEGRERSVAGGRRRGAAGAAGAVGVGDHQRRGHHPPWLTARGAIAAAAVVDVAAVVAVVVVAVVEKQGLGVGVAGEEVRGEAMRQEWECEPKQQVTEEEEEERRTRRGDVADGGNGGGLGDRVPGEVGVLGDSGLPQHSPGSCTRQTWVSRQGKTTTTKTRTRMKEKKKKKKRGRQELSMLLVKSLITKKREEQWR